MKIIINATNTIEDRPLREVDRLITAGKGHLPEVKTESVKTFDEFIRDHEYIKPSEITFEDLDELNIFREPVKGIDIIEPIPIDHYVDFEEPKISRPKKKVKK